MADSSWFTALTSGYPPGSADLHGAAAEYAGVEAAWNSDEPVLLIWLAARLAPTFADLSAVVRTAARLVEQRLRHLETRDMDPGSLTTRVQDVVAGGLDRQALSHAMGEASVHRAAA